MTCIKAVAVLYVLSVTSLIVARVLSRDLKQEHGIQDSESDFENEATPRPKS